MRFRKLRVVSPVNVKWDNKDGVTEDWYLLIGDAVELYTYLEMDTELMSRALITMPRNSKDHVPSPRGHMLATAIELATFSAKENEQVWPHRVMSDLMHNKMQTMLKMIASGDEVQVNHAGGFCSVRGFDETWNPTVLETLEKASPLIPNGIEPKAVDVLFLENAERVHYDAMTYFHQTFGYEGITRLELKVLGEQEPEYVARCIALAKNVIAHTSLADTVQVDAMMALFSKMEGKRVHLCVPDKGVLEAHPLWEAVSARHEVIFFEPNQW